MQRFIVMCGLFIAAGLPIRHYLLTFRHMEQTISITVSGMVQGVYYRQSTKEKALELGISGLVKNLPNGNVQILATGTADQLDQLVLWCKQGPPHAKVTDVQVENITPQVFMGFVIQR
jgi:acylphosphatase